MKAKSGRASYTPQDKQLRVDPGAEAVAVWISQVCQRIQDSIWLLFIKLPVGVSLFTFSHIEMDRHVDCFFTKFYIQAI